MAANQERTADALLAEFERRRRVIADLSASAFQALTVLDGADEPLASHVVAERLLVSSASMTSLLDTLERRGLVERRPHPSDRRRVLIHLTDEARAIVDQMLPAVHGTSRDALAPLSEDERQQLITLLTTMRACLADLADRPPVTPKSRRRPRGPGNLYKVD